MGFGRGFKFGDTPTSTLIERFKLDDGEVKFITILDVNNPVASLLHFMSPLGTFHCWRTEDDDGIIQKGSCCKIMEEAGLNSYPSQKLVLPVAVFKTIDSKTYNENSITFARIELTTDDYKGLMSELSDEDIEPQDVVKHVLRVKGSLEGKGNYKRVAPTFKLKGKTPILSDNGLKEQVRDFLAKYHELIMDSLGKTIDEDKLRKIVDQNKLEAGEVTTKETSETKPANVDTSVIPEEIAETPTFDESIDLSSIMDEGFLSD